MWIVRAALRRPYTIAILSLLALLLGAMSVTRMAIDIFPVIDIPVVMVAWNYPGLSAEEMERRVVIISERSFSTTVNGIERIESQSIPGIGLIKVYFHAGIDIGAAIAQINSVSNTVLRILPPGIQPPIIIQFSAGNVPIVQLTGTSNSLPEEKIYDYALNSIRVQLFTIPGLAVPAPFGGKSRQIMVEIDPRAMAAKGLSANDVMNALSTSNVIVPAGTARMGPFEYNILMNSSPPSVKEFAGIPVKVVNGAPVLLGDIAKVGDGFADQVSVVHVDGHRAAYLTILKKADASALAVVDATREKMAMIRSTAPEGLELKLDFDQSIFVRAAIKNVVQEAIISSILVSLMILVFLGSWRGMVIVSVSIPLAVFCALIGLKLTGNTINLMTLGGLALAIGMLVDDATVAVENIHRHASMGEPLTVAIVNGSQGIALPALVSTLAICIVFFPVVLLFGAAKYLFTPLAASVVMSMLASYVLSRTLVPVMVRQLGLGHTHEDDHGVAGVKRRRGLSDVLRHAVEWWFSRLQGAYTSALTVVMHNRLFTLLAALALAAVTGVLSTQLGLDFYPGADVGLMKLHVRAPAGTRIEETEKLVIAMEDTIRASIPAAELGSINDLIGVPIFFNLAFVPTDNVSGMDAEVLVSLKGEHRPTEEYIRKLRQRLAHDYPGIEVYFMPADIVAQVLNFGLSAPVDIQIMGADLFGSYEVAKKIRDRVRKVPGVVDTHIIQALNYPAFKVDVDRVRAAQLGLSQRDIANSTLVALSSSSLIGPSYFLNTQNGVNYTVAVQVPQKQITTVPQLLDTTLAASGAAALNQPAEAPSPAAMPSAPSTTLGNVAKIYPVSSLEQVSHYTLARTVDVAANLDRRDLGSTVNDIRAAIADVKDLPKNTQVVIRGQDQVMHESFNTMAWGLLLSVVLVYALMVVLFQSWIDPFIIMMAVPGALVGIVWMLAITGTTINVVSMMGSIMSIGIAVANSILLVSFANDVRVHQDISPIAAAIEAGKTRLRPVLMTALAMIIGMIPMALGTGEAGEQNAPLGRAVIGGLAVATLTTLFIVPVLYSLLRRRPPSAHTLDERFREEMEAGSEPTI